MINVNYGRSTKILDACKPLKEYAWIVDQIRENEGEIENVIDKSISDMPDDLFMEKRTWGRCGESRKG